MEKVLRIVISNPALLSLKSNYEIDNARMINLGDLNGDGKDEIGFEPQGHGRFYSYHVWTLDSEKWVNVVEPFTSVEYLIIGEQAERPPYPPIKRHPKKKGYVLIYEYDQLTEYDPEIKENVYKGDTIKIKSVRVSK